MPIFSFPFLQYAIMTLFAFTFRTILVISLDTFRHLLFFSVF